MQIIKRILTFLSIFLIYVVFREFLELFALTYAIHPFFGYLTLAAITAFVLYFIAVPIYRIMRIPQNYGPAKRPDDVPELIELRLRNFRKNPYLLKIGFDFDDIGSGQAAYARVVARLHEESEKLRKRYVLQLFYSSSISQNGFLDAILILSSSVNLVKEMFVLYHGRVSNKDLFAIARRVYMSMAIGGSEGVELATQELFSKVATDSVKSVPFADKIFGSLADGFVNAALLTRVSLITENYCKMLHIKSERDLFPAPQFIVRTTKFITGDIFDKMILELVRMSRQKTVDYVMFAVNPVAHLFGKTFGMVSEGTTKLASYPVEIFKDVAAVANKPFVYGIDRLASIFRREQPELDDFD